MLFNIVKNTPLTADVYELVLEGESHFTAAGQFAQLSLDGFFLRRPISLCDCKNGEMTLVYKSVGQGTDAMTRLKAGDTIDALTGLGNGFNTEKGTQAPLVIGGGVGIPPLYLLTKKLIAQGKEPTVILGFNSRKEMFLTDRFEALGVKTIITTVDGSYGIKGFVTTAFDSAEYAFSCGPLPMLRAVADKCGDAQLSLEERMGCGFGVCMGCSHRTVNGYKRICKEGPVLEKGEILWT